MDDTKASNVKQHNSNLQTKQFPPQKTNKKQLLQVEDKSPLLKANTHIIQPNFRPIIDFNTGNQVVSFNFQPARSVYYPPILSPNIIQGYVAPQSIRYPPDIYYYYPI